MAKNVARVNFAQRKDVETMLQLMGFELKLRNSSFSTLIRRKPFERGRDVGAFIAKVYTRATLVRDVKKRGNQTTAEDAFKGDHDAALRYLQYRKEQDEEA